MQFGLFYEAPEDARYTHVERYAEMFDLIAYGETLGFDVAWMAEIHFGGAFSLMAVPLMAIPVIAQRTQRIRLGTAVTLLPLHHPLSLAEQSATADLLCGGRLEFGVGRGSIPTHFHGFGVSLEENRARFDECLEVIRLAWTRERFSYTGQFYTVENVSVVPKPLQQPHPPIRVGVHTADSFAHIGDLGLPIYSGTTTTPMPQLREGMALYRTHLKDAGYPWLDNQAALMMPLHVASTSPAAREAMRPGVEKFYASMHTILSYLPATYTGHQERLSHLRKMLENFPFERFCQQQGVFGDPYECIDRLQAARDEFNLCQIICWFDQGCMLSVQEVKRSMAQFADEVMPKI
jgi:alkanesulfonate monooxygenase SsuD/methylene tetrahydromethanopterin reductase-like flavin-dependent oxidoreductase (luciferase family)